MNHDKKTVAKEGSIFQQQLIEHIKMTVKNVNIKNHTYFLFNDMVDLKIFDSNLLKLDKESYKNTGIYYNGYITIKKPMIMRVLIVYVLRT